MQYIVEKQPTLDAALLKPQLFQVWIDVNCGHRPAEWEWNSPPKPIELALDEAADCRLEGFPARIMLEGKSPRLDGSFD